MTWRTRALILLVAAGLVVSSYLVLKNSDPASVACSIAHGCETVLSSKYAYIGPVPVSVLGLVWYLVFLGLIYMVSWQRFWPNSYIKIWTALGLVFSLYLLALEIFVIHAYCQWCLGSLVIVSLLFALVWGTKDTSMTELTHELR